MYHLFEPLITFHSDIKRHAKSISFKKKFKFSKIHKKQQNNIPWQGHQYQ
jgi:hypothetical protein